MRKIVDATETFETNDELPDWAQGIGPPEVIKEVEAALAAGKSKREFHSKLMVLRLEDA